MIARSSWVAQMEFSINSQGSSSLKQRVLALVWFSLLFTTSYLASLSMAAKQALPNLVTDSALTAAAVTEGVSTNSLQLPFEQHMPFIPLFILPYLSSGLLLAWLFLRKQTAAQLRLLSQRLNLTTLFAACCFMLWPNRFAFDTPALGAYWLGEQLQPLFALLYSVDDRYNQCPSLHVAYALLAWFTVTAELKTPWQRGLVALWLLLLMSSTLLIYQHHLLDLVGATVLVSLVFWLVPTVQPQQGVFYLTAALLSVLLALYLGWLLEAFQYWRYVAVASSWYLALSCLLISQAHWRGDRQFLHKKNGRHPCWIWLLYAPYLLGYRLTWLAVLWRERKNPAFTEFAPNLWVGRRLTAPESKQLPANCWVIDLSCELPEQAALLKAPHQYWHFPLLDLTAVDSDTSAPAIAKIQQILSNGGCIYLHCAMGYSRSKAVAYAIQHFKN